MKRILATLAIATACIQSPLAAQTSPYCQADLVFDNNLNFVDVSAFVAAFTQGNLTADFNGDGILNFADVAAFVQVFQSGCPNLTDTDGDRLPDYVETNNGLYLNEFNTGSDPLNPDTDGDFLSDGDEVLWTTDGLVLPDASPVYKDIFIECDWFAGNFQGRNENFRPTNAVNNRISAAFANAPTPNPYGLPDGIAIHLDYGQDAQNTGGNQLPGDPDVIQFDWQFNQYKSNHFDPRRKGYYHYAIFANRYNSSNNGSTGIAELNGDDFMITLYSFNTTYNMSQIIVHELGHNLGLHHGGHESRNGKPNYNSVMNYRYTFPGIDTTGNAIGNGSLDFSRDTYLDINENAINESDGVDGLLPIDWNQNGIIDPAPYARNINCGSGSAPCGSWGSSCYDSSCNTLRDYDDWNNINWNRLNQSVDRQSEIQIIDCDNWPGK